MGMFDSLYDTNGHEWQTKAYDCLLDRYQIGDRVPGFPATYQVEVFGGPRNYLGTEELARDSYANIREGRLSEVPAERDETLPLMDYHGHVTMPDEQLKGETDDTGTHADH